jgi:glucose/arabinose dehydrogenase
LPDILAIGQGGLLDLQLHPNYAENNWVYFAYAKPSDSNPNAGNTAIMRTKLSGNALTNKELLFEGLPATSGSVHFGSRMVFDNLGYLWFGIGDRGNRDLYPQSLDNHAGKILRIHDDGRIPDDNPFVDSLGALPEIYSYGHRNPQGIDLHPQTGRIWMTEHGPRGGDEINLIGKGLNYGWPVISYGINYNGTKFTELTEKEGMEQPQLYWDPSIAPCGTVFITGDRYPAWKHNLLIGSLKFRYLERVELDGNTPVAQEKLLEGIGRVRHVAMGPDGYIYVAVEKPGFIVKLIPVEK